MFDTSELNLINEKENIKEHYAYNEIIHINRTVPLDGDYSFFTEDKFPHGFIFYDFEVFKWDWLVVLIDPINRKKTIIANDRNALKHYFDENSNKIWVGYNNMHYDVPILKGILLGMNPKEISDQIIVEGKKEYEISKEFRKIRILSFDCYDGMNGLKVLEAFMGHNIEETEVPFDIQRPLNKKEIYQTIFYCTHDVEETIQVFIRRIYEFDSSMTIIDMFDFPIDYVSKTKGQLTALVVDCERKEHDDEFDITFVPVLQLNKYKYVQDWFERICKQKSYNTLLPSTPENEYILSKGRQLIKEKTVGFETYVSGVPHQFGFGGVHGAPLKPIHKNGKLFHCDVTSFYPSEMIVYKFLTRNCKEPKKFQDVYDTRVALKKAGKKKEQAPYKVILNSQYGITKDKYSTAYDPVQANNICINGQLLLLDLLEHLEVMGDHYELIQSNTDGIIVWIDNEPKSEKWLRHITNEWINRTGMGLGLDEWGGVDENGNNLHHIGIVQKDVNGYVGIFKNGKIEAKGAYVKELDDLDNDLPIVNRALVEFITKGTPVEETINASNDMIDFQKVFKLSAKFKSAWHNGQTLNNKCYRVYASTDKKDTFLGRCREVGGNPLAFGNCPEHCFIYNKDVKGVPLSIKLDKQWYINLARKRLQDFGYEFQDPNALF